VLDLTLYLGASVGTVADTSIVSGVATPVALTATVGFSDGSSTTIQGMGGVIQLSPGTIATIELAGTYTDTTAAPFNWVLDHYDIAQEPDPYTQEIELSGWRLLELRTMHSPAELGKALARAEKRCRRRKGRLQGLLSQNSGVG